MILQDNDNEFVTLNINKIPHKVRMDKDVPIKVLMKKAHPCGNSEFLLLRVGMDFKLQCTKCGHTVMGARNKIEKNIKKVLDKT